MGCWCSWWRGPSRPSWTPSCSYSPDCVEGLFCELRLEGVLGSYPTAIDWSAWAERCSRRCSCCAAPFSCSWEPAPWAPTSTSPRTRPAAPPTRPPPELPRKGARRKPLPRSQDPLPPHEDEHRPRGRGCREAGFRGGGLPATTLPVTLRRFRLVLPRSLRVFQVFLPYGALARASTHRALVWRCPCSVRP
jgi:hypothetical protein